MIILWRHWEMIGDKQYFVTAGQAPGLEDNGDVLWTGKYHKPVISHIVGFVEIITIMSKISNNNIWQHHRHHDVTSAIGSTTIQHQRQ